MTRGECVITVLVLACAAIGAVLVAELRRLTVFLHEGWAYRTRALERQERAGAELRSAKERRREAAATREADLRAKAEIRRTTRRARDASAEAERWKRLESILIVLLTHVRHIDPEIADAPKDQADSEKGRPTADLDLGASPARGATPALLPSPPAPAPRGDDAALRAAGLHKSTSRARSDTRPSIPSPIVRDPVPSVEILDRSGEERPSCEELTIVSDRGMDLRLQAALSGPLVPVRIAMTPVEQPATTRPPHTCTVCRGTRYVYNPSSARWDRSCMACQDKAAAPSPAQEERT